MNMAGSPAVDVLGIANVIECELEINPDYNSFCFKLDGGVEFNVVPNIINEKCITAEGSPELPQKCMVSGSSLRPRTLFVDHVRCPLHGYAMLRAAE